MNISFVEASAADLTPPDCQVPGVSGMEVFSPTPAKIRQAYMERAHPVIVADAVSAEARPASAASNLLSDSDRGILITETFHRVDKLFLDLSLEVNLSTSKLMEQWNHRRAWYTNTIAEPIRQHARQVKNKIQIIHKAVSQKSLVFGCKMLTTTYSDG